MNRVVDDDECIPWRVRGADGILYTWGCGQRGVLGLGDESDVSAPTAVVTGISERIAAVDSSWSHTIAVAESGTVYSFGNRQYGKLGF